LSAVRQNGRHAALAEVLGYVLQSKAHREHGGLRLSPPTELEVPPEMDPDNPASASPLS
jgi:flagellar biosynthetic protein FlhB